MLIWLVLITLPARGADVSSSTWRARALNEARSWMFQVADLDDPKQVEALARTEYPLLVIDPGDDLNPPLPTAIVLRALRRTPSGVRRLILASIDVGQAHDDRAYWRPYWTAPTTSFHGYPEFLLRLGEDRPGDYPVAFWRPQWRRIWLDRGGRAQALARLGFDGLLVDGVEQHATPAVADAAAADGVDPAQAMMALLADLRAAGRRVVPDFLVLAQNAIYLVGVDTRAYAGAVDGVVAEETFFNGVEGSAWDSSTAGDQRGVYDEPGWSTRERLDQYAVLRRLGLPVFTVDYCVDPADARMVYQAAAEAGLRPLVTRYPLSRLTPTPPPWLPAPAP